MSYYVVALEREDPLVRGNEFHEIGCRLIREATERVMAEIRRTGDPSFVKSLGHAETYTFAEVLPGAEHALPGWAKAHLPTEEFARFGKVYFLNEPALKMYREGGVEFDVYRVIADDELPAGCSRGISAPYLPKAG